MFHKKERYRNGCSFLVVLRQFFKNKGKPAFFYGGAKIFSFIRPFIFNICKKSPAAPIFSNAAIKGYADISFENAAQSIFFLKIYFLTSA